MVGKYTNTMKKVHKIGKHGAFLLITQQGEICLECGKRVNNRGTNPRGTDGRFTSSPPMETKSADSLLSVHFGDVMKQIDALAEEVKFLKRNVNYDCPVCNPAGKVSRWHDHEKDEI